MTSCGFLTAVKEIWDSRVTTVFTASRACTPTIPQVLAELIPQADVVVEAIGELAGWTLDKVLKRQLT